MPQGAATGSGRVGMTRSTQRAFQILGGVLFLALAVLIGSRVIQRVEVRQPDLPDTADSFTDWMCEKCGDRFRLTARQVDQWRRSRDRVRRDATAPRLLTVFWCDKCREFSVTRAMLCPAHRVWYSPQHPDGRWDDCPLCLDNPPRQRPGVRPATPRPPAGDETSPPAGAAPAPSSRPGGGERIEPYRLSRLTRPP
jgi:hypothetical protein